MRCELLFHEILANPADYVAGKEIHQKNVASIAREYMDLNVYPQISIGELSHQTGLSPAQLTRVFKQEYGQTPYQYFLQNKLTTACFLLRNTNLRCYTQRIQKGLRCSLSPFLSYSDIL